MNALVLTDGSAAATKAIELAGVAGGPLMPTHDSAQLIIAHMWHKSPAYGAVFSPEAVDGATTNGSGTTTTANGAETATSAAGNNAAANHSNAPQVVAPPATVEAAVRAAVQTASTPFDSFATQPESAAAAAASLPHQQPAVFVVQRALQTIHESKSLKDSLNYKMETHLFPPLPPLASLLATGQCADAAAPEEEEGEAKAMRQRSAAARQTQGQGKAASPAATVTVTAADKRKTPDSGGGAGAGTAAAAAAVDETEMQRRHRATSVVQYAAARAAHHGCHAIVLGAGGTQAGKAIVVGSVARQALCSLRATHLLCFVKADGLSLRPSTAAVRFVVVVPVLLRDGGEAQEAAAAVVVRQARSWCRPHTKDRVVAVLVTEPYAEAEEEEEGQAVERCAARFSQLLGGPSAEGVDAVGPREEIPPTPSPAAATDAVKVDGQPDTNAATAAEWPAVSVCELKPTKHHPSPTIDSPAVSQVAKFIQQRKAEMVVAAAAAPEPLQLALMAMVKPHCFIVPTPTLRQS